MKRAIPILAAGAVLLLGNLVAAQHGQGHGQAPAAAARQEDAPTLHAIAPMHGGTAGTAGAYGYETVLEGGEIRMYLYSSEGVPLEAAKLAGTATVTFPGRQPKQVALAPAKPKEGEPAVYYCPMHPEATSNAPGECRACGGMKLMAQDFLRGDLKIAADQVGPAKIAATVKGIGGKDEQLTFQQTVQLGKVSETQKKG